MLSRIPAIIHEGDCQPFEGIELSSKSFYSKLETLIEEKNMPGVTLDRITLSEGRMLSHNREYLRIRRKEFMFDVCAAPFGTPCFISWRLGENPTGIKGFLYNLGVIGAWRAKKSIPTRYYQADSDHVFKTIVKDCISSSIDSLALPKGTRGFAELGNERNFNQKVKDA